MELELHIQRELPLHSVVSIAYVGHRGYHDWDVYDINQAPAGTLQANPGVNINALRPYKGFAAIQEEESGVNSLYNGLQVTWSRRFTAGSMFNVSYTFSKSRTTARITATLFRILTIRAISGGLPNSTYGM